MYSQLLSSGLVFIQKIPNSHFTNFSPATFAISQNNIELYTHILIDMGRDHSFSTYGPKMGGWV